MFLTHPRFPALAHKRSCKDAMQGRDDGYAVGALSKLKSKPPNRNRGAQRWIQAQRPASALSSERSTESEGAVIVTG